jgi:hypothetical protein
MTWQRGMSDVPLLDCLAADLAARVAQAIGERLAAE